MSSNPSDARDDDSPHAGALDGDLGHRPSFEEEEDVMLAHFDRYIDSEAPLNPQRPSELSHVRQPTLAETGATEPRPAEMSHSDTGDAHPGATDTAHTAAAQPASPALEILTASYPSYDPEALRSILLSVGNDFNAAEALLEGNTASSTLTDAELAARLQRREQRRQRRREQHHQQQQLQQQEQQQGQQQEQQQEQQHGQQLDQQRHRRNDAPIPLEKPAMDRVVATLREIVVPSLRAHFAELVLPNWRDDSASLVYSLSQLQVIALTLPSENVAITPSTSREAVHVNVLNSHLELEVGQWSYENRGLVPVKDSGRASVSVHGLNISVRLEPRWSHSGGTRLVIVECNVTVDGAVRFKTHGAAADWAYNAIAVVLKPLVVSYVKEAVADAVTQALATHLRQWAFTDTLDGVDAPSSHAANASSAPVTAAE